MSRVEGVEFIQSSEPQYPQIATSQKRQSFFFAHMLDHRHLLVQEVEFEAAHVVRRTEAAMPSAPHRSSSEASTIRNSGQIYEAYDALSPQFYPGFLFRLH